MPASRLALVAPFALSSLLGGCVLYAGGDDEPPPADAAWPWDPIDAPWGPQPDAWPNNCWAGSQLDCPQIGGSSCFVYPQSIVVNADGSSPNTACTAPAPGTTASLVVLSGSLRDFQSGDAVVGQVEIFDALDLAPLADAATASDGDWAVSLPAGVPTQLTVRTQGAGYVDVYDPQLLLDGNVTQMRGAMTASTGFLAALPAFVGISHQPGTGMVMVEVRDCDGQPIANALVTLATEPGTSGVCPTFQEWARTFYGEAGTGLPVSRNQLNATDVGGRAFLVEVPPSGVYSVQYVQVWGFTDVATNYVDGMTLLAEIPVHTFGDSITRVTATPAL